MSFRAFVANILGTAKTSESGNAEQDLLAAVEHVVGKVDPKVRRASNYRKQLKPAVRRTLEYADDLAGRIPGPFRIQRDLWDKDPLIHALFTAPSQVDRLFFETPEIVEFFQTTPADQVYAVLTVTKLEKIVYGVGGSGNLFKRDVPQTAVEFNDHRVRLTVSEAAELPRELREEMLTYLAGQALEEILRLKSWHQELMEEKEILAMKLKIRRSRDRESAHLLDNAPDTLRIIEAERVLQQLNQKIGEVRGQLDEPGDYLEHVQKVLMHPQNYVTVAPETLQLNSMGIKISAASPEPANEINLARISLNQGPQRFAVSVNAYRADLPR